jgi:hypothetical protein
VTNTHKSTKEAPTLFRFIPARGDGPKLILFTTFWHLTRILCVMETLVLSNTTMNILQFILSRVTFNMECFWVEQSNSFFIDRLPKFFCGHLSLSPFDVLFNVIALTTTHKENYCLYNECDIGVVIALCEICTTRRTPSNKH